MGALKNKYLVLLSLTGVFISFDQLTKIYVHTHFLLHENIKVIPGFFNLTYVRNTGAAFGILRDNWPVLHNIWPGLSEAWPLVRNVFFLSMPPVAVVIIIVILQSLSERDRLQITALSLIAGGALGNYADRLRLGYVVDFLELHYKDFVWPAFNIADVGIVLGVSIISLVTILEIKNASHQAKERA